jgi:hypothetical protein
MEFTLFKLPTKVLEAEKSFGLIGSVSKAWSDGGTLKRMPRIKKVDIKVRCKQITF